MKYNVVRTDTQGPRRQSAVAFAVQGQARDRRRLGFLERHLPAQRAAHGRIPGEVQQAREPHPLRFHLARQEPEARDEVREEDEAPRDLHLLA